MSELHDFLVFREFAFAPEVLTLCAKSRDALVSALGSENHPFIGTKITSHPVATYLPAQALKKLKFDYWMVPGVSSLQVSKVLPTSWLVGLTDGVKVYGLAAMSPDGIQELNEQVETHGQKIAAFPLPSGLEL